MTTTFHNQTIDSLIIHDYKNNSTNELKFETFRKELHMPLHEMTMYTNHKEAFNHLMNKYTKIIRREIAESIANMVTIKQSPSSDFKSMVFVGEIRVIPSYDQEREINKLKDTHRMTMNNLIKYNDMRLKECYDTIDSLNHMSVKDSFKRLIKSIFKRY